MEEKIQIVCPNCGTLLAVKKTTGIEGKNITCPACRKTSPFTSFRIKTGAEGDDRTQYGGHGKDLWQSGEEAFGDRHALGRLYVQGTSLSFQLREGTNIIGRQSAGSQANIQIPCASRRISREHLVIEAERVPQVGFVYYVSLNKEQVNPTYIGDCCLQYGDKLVLRHNDIIRLPDMELRFEITEEE